MPLALLLMLAPLVAGPTPRIGFATAIALQGNDLFAGHPGTALGWQFNPSRPGAVHHFVRGTDGTWHEATSLAPDDLLLGDGFGGVLALDDRLLAVSAEFQGGGAVYLFAGEGPTWRQTAKITRTDGGPHDRFGHALALRNGLLIIGAPGAREGRGTIYAYRRDDAGRWSGVPAVQGEHPGEQLGAALSFDGSLLAAGAPAGLEFPSPPGPMTPFAAIYRITTGRDPWQEVARLRPARTAPGYALALLLAHGNLYVGAPGADRGAGGVEIYRPVGGDSTWSLVDRLQPPDAATITGFGLAMAAGDSLLVIGAPLAEGRFGAVYPYHQAAGGWTLDSTLTVGGATTASMFGHVLAVDGTHLAIGAPTADFWEGTGWLYQRDATGAWREVTSILPSSAALSAMTGAEHRCQSDSTAGYGCRQTDLLAFLPVSAIGGTRGGMLNDMWGWTDPETQREYALVGRVDGTAFIDVTDPIHPVYLGDLPMHEGAHPSKWRDIKVYQHYAYIVADAAGPHGMQIFDLTRLRNPPAIPATFTEDGHYDRFAESHNLVIDEATGFGYAVGSSGGESCGGGLHMIALHDPLHPVFAGCHTDPAVGLSRRGAVHDAQCVIYRGPDRRYQGRELCFNAAESALAIVDVTDKAAPKTLSVAAYPNTAYAHQGWLTEDHAVFFMGDEEDELAGTVSRTRTLAWDLRDLEDPVLLTEFLGTTSATDHNLYIRGGVMYQSNYAAGLRIVDISDPAHPRETGYFDSVPGGNDPGFAGSWSNYPFFPSGTIVFTSRKEGIFVVRYHPPALTP